MALPASPWTVMGINDRLPGGGLSAATSRATRRRSSLLIRAIACFIAKCMPAHPPSLKADIERRFGVDIGGKAGRQRSVDRSEVPGSVL